MPRSVCGQHVGCPLRPPSQPHCKPPETCSGVPEYLGSPRSPCTLHTQTSSVPRDSPRCPRPSVQVNSTSWAPAVFPLDRSHPFGDHPSPQCPSCGCRGSGLSPEPAGPSRLVNMFQVPAKNMGRKEPICPHAGAIMLQHPIASHWDSAYLRVQPTQSEARGTNS